MPRNKERRAQYDRYIASPAWRAKRKLAIEAVANRCQDCGVYRTYGLHVHHLTYERFMNELMSDLHVVCEDCHFERHHMKLPRLKKDKLRQDRPWVRVGKNKIKNKARAKLRYAPVKVYFVDPKTLRRG